MVKKINKTTSNSLPLLEAKLRKAEYKRNHLEINHKRANRKMTYWKIKYDKAAKKLADNPPPPATLLEGIASLKKQIEEEKIRTAEHLDSDN